MRETPAGAGLPAGSAGLDRAGVWFALSAFGFWGVAPVYFHAVDFAGPLEIVAHRIVWSVVVLALLILARRQWRNLVALTRREIAWLALSGLLIGGNWVLFVWALLNDRLLDASLGYFINPLVNVVLGIVFFAERLRPAQWLALLLAACGVVHEIVAVGVLPWVGLCLAFSFALYGLIRKRVGVGAAVGLGVETALVLPLALGYLGFAAWHGHGVLVDGSSTQVLLLAGAGLVTVFPLVCFASAAARLPLGILGFFQYLAPSLMFLLAIFVYAEPFRPSQLVTFGAIWLGLVIFSVEALYHQQRIVPIAGEDTL